MFQDISSEAGLLPLTSILQARVRDMMQTKGNAQ